jgi:hypothetical protein
LLLAGCGNSTSQSTALAAVPAVPAPLLDEDSGQAQSEIAVLARGCFWGVQGSSSMLWASPRLFRELDQAAVFKAPIVTRIEPDQTFYTAEAYHQDYLTRNPTYPYIVINDLPKVENLKRIYPDLYRADPALVAAAGTH